MVHMHSCLMFSPKYHYGCTKTLTSPLSQIHGVLNTTLRKKYSIKCPRNSFNLTNKIRSCKQFNKYRCLTTLQDGYKPNPLHDNNYSTSFQDVFFRNLNALYCLTRPYTWIGTIIAITSVSFLPIQNLSVLTPTLFVEILKALVPAVLMNVYVVALNQLSDLEIDKINKPDLPLASGDFSTGTGVAVYLVSSFTVRNCEVPTVAMGVISRSPPLLLAFIIWFLLGTAYSIQLPFLRWKGHPFLAPTSMMILMGLVYQLLFYIHIQKYVLARPVIITKPLVFATTFMSVFSFANGLLKDVPDVDGDREFGIQTLSVIIGKEKVFWLGVYMMLTAYGAAILVGTSSSFLLSKLVTIISHSILAFILWLRAQTVDLSNKASTLSFYMFIWKLHYVEYLLIHFVR